MIVIFSERLFLSRQPAPDVPGTGCTAICGFWNEVSLMRLNRISPLWIVIPDAVLTAMLLAGWFLL